MVLLSLAYGITFGAELAVVSLLPTFFASTFGLNIGAASAAGSAFAFTNLVTRPGGGLLSDVTGERRRWVVVALLGTAASFGLLALLDGSWPLPLGVAVVALASVFVQGGNGAVFAMVPLVHKPASGPIAGLAGSYGNIGGIAFSSILFLTHGDAQVLFLVVAASAVVVALLCRWLPDTVMAEQPAEALVVAAPSVSRWPRACPPWSDPDVEPTPRFVQAIRAFSGAGLDDYQPFDPPLTYTVPDGASAQCVYLRAGNSSDELVCVVLTRDGVPMRLFPLGARSSVHIPLRITEELMTESVLELHASAPRGIHGTLVIDLGILEI